VGKLPMLISVPHAGLGVPSHVSDLCRLTEDDIIKDGDEGAGEIYFPLQNEVTAFVHAETARAIVDVNRSETDRGKDGVIKTHTCWDIPVYKRMPSEKTVANLINYFYHPYHEKLTAFAGNVILGIDCHTMAPKGPPVGPDPGTRRPRVCLSNANGTCPKKWITLLAECFQKTFERGVSINHPFKGGFITRHHSREVPWIQVELSRSGFMSNTEKSTRVLDALKSWYKKAG